MEIKDLKKITKKRYKAESTRVLTRKDLQDALKVHYEKIIVEGELGERLYNEMNGVSYAKYIKDKIADAVFANGSLKSLKKDLKDYKMTSSNEKQTIIELKSECKGFKK